MRRERQLPFFPGSRRSDGVLLTGFYFRKTPWSADAGFRRHDGFSGIRSGVESAQPLFFDCRAEALAVDVEIELAFGDGQRDGIAPLDGLGG